MRRATSCTTTGGEQDVPDEAFSIRFDSALRDDLRRRLAQVRWSDAVTADWRYGTDERFLKALVGTGARPTTSMPRRSG